MIITFDDLAIKYKDYTDIKGRIRRDIQAGKLTQVSRGVYESNANTDGKYLAGLIYGPIKDKSKLELWSEEFFDDITNSIIVV